MSELEPPTSLVPQPTARGNVAIPPLYSPQQIGGTRSGRAFAFTGGAATYFGTAILGLVITVCTLGICYPFAVVLVQRWRCKHSYINGQQMVFTGSAWGLFGNWVKWFLLCIVTIGIYGFWVAPRIARWKWEHTSFAAPTLVTPAR